MRRLRKMSRIGGPRSSSLIAPSAGRPRAGRRRAACRRPRRPSTCTRRRPAEQHQEALLALAQDQAGRARHRAGPQARDRQRRSRTSIAQKRAKVSRAGGTATVSAAERAGHVERPRAPGSRSAAVTGRSRACGSGVSGHHQASRAPASLIAAPCRLRRRAPPSRPAARACGGARRPPSRPFGDVLAALVGSRRRSSRRGLEAGAGGAALLLHRAVRETLAGVDRSRNARLTSAPPRRRGRRTAASRLARACCGRRRRSSIVAPSWATDPGTQARPITRPSCGEWRALVTCPAGVPACRGPPPLGRHDARRRG